MQGSVNRNRFGSFHNYLQYVSPLRMCGGLIKKLTEERKKHRFADMETETIEELKIKCPNCSGSKLTQNVPEMQFDKDYMFCGVCGLVLSIVWIKNTAEILKEAQK